MQLTFILGPLLAGLTVGTGGFGWAYAIDVLSFAGAFYAALRLPSLPPGEGARRAGLASVVEGLRFLRSRPVVLTTFVADLIAMIFGMSAALFPALAQQYGGAAGTAGMLYAAPAVGAVVATLLGGAITGCTATDPRLGDLEAGVVAALFSPRVSVISGGLVCLAGIGLLALAVPAFLRYDVRTALVSDGD